MSGERRERGRRGWRGLLWGSLAVVACVAVAGSQLAAGGRSPLSALGLEPRAAVPTFRVQKSEFVHQVTARGNLRAKKSIPVGVPPGVPAPLKIAWTCEDGSRVAAGEVVVRFEPTEFEKSLLDGRSERATAEAKVERERALTALAQRDRKRSAALSERELRAVRELPKPDPEIFSRNQIVESDIDEELSRARRGHADRMERIEAALSRRKLEQIAVERRQADLAISHAERGLASLELRAPADGLIVFERDWQGNVIKVGDAVWAGATVARLPVLDEMEADVYVLEADAGGLAVGKPAHVVLEAHPGREHAARIARVDALAKQPHNGVPTQYFQAALALETTDPSLMKPGGRVKARLELDRREALSVPRHAVFDGEHGKHVFRRQGSRFERVPVTLGPTTPGKVVVLEGLREGDVIALGDPNQAAGDERRGPETAASR